MPQFRFEPEGRFSLATAASFAGAFRPFGLPEVSSDGCAPTMVLSFLTDDWQPVAVGLRQTDRSVVADVLSGSADADADALRRQVARMLSLDLDGRPFDRIPDPVIARLRNARPGLRPVLFATPYEAACWAVLSQRTRLAHAAALRDDLARRRGSVVSIDGMTQHVFPAPDALLRTRTLAGAPAVKLERLHAVARAALDARLDADGLRAPDPEDALDELRGIDGIGPFGSELVLVRGAGAPDVFPRTEPRLQRAMADLYNLRDPSVGELEAVAESWRPRRAWVSFLIRSSRDRNQGGSP